MNTKLIRKSVEDLGAAAYLKMHGFKIVGRKGKVFYFEIMREEENAFHEAMFEYPNSPYHDFDAHIMGLKKLPHFVPSDTLKDLKRAEEILLEQQSEREDQ
jgi:hypothetical protein